MKNSRPYTSGNVLTRAVGRISPRPSFVYGAITLTALLAFEIFNFSTTDFALKDLLGDLSFAGIPWATVLAVAFCSIDFAGIARLFTPDTGSEEPREAWYLFGAWFLAATMNAILTWWGISLAISSHALQSTSVVDPNMLMTVVPVFVALMVWVIRILLIGSLTMTSEQLLEGRVRRQPALLSTAARSRSYSTRSAAPQIAPTPVHPAPRAATPRAASGRFSPPAEAKEPEFNRPEPTYHSLTRTARPSHRPDRSGSGSNNTRRM